MKFDVYFYLRPQEPIENQSRKKIFRSSEHIIMFQKKKFANYLIKKFVNVLPR